MTNARCRPLDRFVGSDHRLWPGMIGLLHSHHEEAAARVPGCRKLVTIVAPSREVNALLVATIGVADEGRIMTITARFSVCHTASRSVPFRSDRVLNWEGFERGRRVALLGGGPSGTDPDR